MFEKEEKISNSNYFYAGFPYLSRKDLLLTLEINIDKDVIIRESDGFYVVDKTLFLGEVQGLRFPLSK